MESIKILNIRSFTETPEIKIKPITLLVGQNSSGKSTLARLIPLIKQSAEVRAREPFLWLGRLVDFGGVSETISKFAKSPELGLGVEIKVQSHLLDGRRRFWNLASDSNTSEIANLSISYKFEKESSNIAGYHYTVKYRNQKIEIEITEAGIISRLRINSRDFSGTWFNDLVVTSWTGPFPIFESTAESIESEKNEFSEILSFVREYLDNRTSEDRATLLAKTLVAGSILKLRERALQSSAGDAYWKRKLKSWSDTSTQYRHLVDLVTINQFFNDIGTKIVTQFRRTAIASRYITPLRASAERYYRLQGLSIEEIDPQGQNIAMFLHNLSIFEKESFSAWMKQFFGISVDTQPSQGHVQLVLTGESDTSDSGYNLADTGFGYSQMLPILVQLWSIGSGHRKSRTPTSIPLLFSIEQPELHLHPRLQAKLADVFLDAVQAARQIGIELKLIIETHSEQIISRLGLRIAKSPELSKDVGIVIFEKSTMLTATKVREVGFTSDGMLEAWPYGFFEADD